MSNAKGPMVRAREIIEAHLAKDGFVPHPEKLKEAIAAEIAFARLASIPHRDDAHIPVSPAPAEEWQWVPKELTKEMIVAGQEQGHRENWVYLTGESVIARWRAMLSASPSPPQEKKK